MQLRWCMSRASIQLRATSRGINSIQIWVRYRISSITSLRIINRMQQMLKMVMRRRITCFKAIQTWVITKWGTPLVLRKASRLKEATLMEASKRILYLIKSLDLARTSSLHKVVNLTWIWIIKTLSTQQQSKKLAQPLKPRCCALWSPLKQFIHLMLTPIWALWGSFNWFQNNQSRILGKDHQV